MCMRARVVYRYFKASPLPPAPWGAASLLIAGCWFAALQFAGWLVGWLAFWLACWLAFLLASLGRTCRAGKALCQNIVFLDVRTNCHFGSGYGHFCNLASLVHLGDHAGETGTWEFTKGHHGVQPWIFIDSDRFSGTSRFHMEGWWWWWGIGGGEAHGWPGGGVRGGLSRSAGSNGSNVVQRTACD